MREIIYHDGKDWAMVTVTMWDGNEYAIAVHGDERREFFGKDSRSDADRYLKGLGYKG